jgi:phage terminase Nu1 subunit (DNA packaging protein)
MSRPNFPRIPSKSLAHLLGVSQRRIAQLVEQGTLPEPEAGQHDPVDACRAYIAAIRDRSVSDSEAAARTRKTEAEASLAELKLKRLEGELVGIEDVAALVAEEYTVVRAKFLSMPSALAGELAMTRDPVAARDVLERAIFAALDELSGGDELAQKVAACPDS